jgi:hypothetical protein
MQLDLNQVGPCVLPSDTRVPHVNAPESLVPGRVGLLESLRCRRLPAPHSSGEHCRPGQSSKLTRMVHPRMYLVCNCRHAVLGASSHDTHMPSLLLRLHASNVNGYRSAGISKKAKILHSSLCAPNTLPNEGTHKEQTRTEMPFTDQHPQETGHAPPRRICKGIVKNGAYASPGHCNTAFPLDCCIISAATGWAHDLSSMT